MSDEMGGMLRLMSVYTRYSLRIALSVAQSNYVFILVSLHLNAA
jgi:hypothetical protein